jgi:hypothetical protein
MIKSELVQIIATRNPHLFLRDVENIVSAIFDEITDALADGTASSCAVSALFRSRTALPAPAATRAPANPSRSRKSGCLSSRPARSCASG